MFEILTVCTGNVCRSPLAELLLRSKLSGLPGRIHSAGTYDLGSAPMTTQAQQLAVQHGVSAQLAAAHRSQSLFDQDLTSPDLILVMTRSHRRDVLELMPTRMRSVFTIREFARLARTCTDVAIITAAREAEREPSARLRAAVGVVASIRGMGQAAPADPTDDDVTDPYRRSWETYQLSANQLIPAVDEVTRIVRLAATNRPDQ